MQETILTFTKCPKLHFQQQAMLFEKKSLSESHRAAVFRAPKAFVEMGLQKVMRRLECKTSALNSVLFKSNVTSN